MNAYLLSQTPLLVALLFTIGISAIIRFRNERGTAWIGALGLIASAYYVFLLPEGAVYFGESIRISAGGKIAALLVLGLSAAILLLSDPYLEKVGVHPADWRSLQLILTLGAVHATLAGDLFTFFISFETASVLSAATVGMSRLDRRSNEAGLKYLLLGVLSGVILLLGVALLFGASGSANYERIAQALSANSGLKQILAAAGMTMILSALLFKVAAAPFHFWLADVYQGSSLAALAVIGAPVKAAAFAVIALLCHGPLLPLQALWTPLLAGAAMLSFVFGGLQGLGQQNLKRLLASSAVVHAGFALLAIAAGPRGAWSWQLYIAVYGIQTVSIVALFMALGDRHADVDTLNDLNGLLRSAPALTIALSATLFAFAGLPPTAGFAAKFAAIYAAIQQGMLQDGLWLIAAAGVGAVASTLSLYFYFRLIRSLWFQAPAAADGPREYRWSYLAVGGLGAAFLAGAYLFALLSPVAAR